MSKRYKNRASEVAYFIDFNFAIFAMFKTLVLLIASECLKLDFRNVLEGIWLEFTIRVKSGETFKCHL